MKSFKNYGLLFIIPIFLIGILSFARVEAQAEEEETSSSPEYTINEGDVLHISVWQEETLDQEVIVRPDGRISFPLAGDVPAVGLTFSQLKEQLILRFKEYIRHPVVSITLRKMGGKKIIVLGEVNHPGVYSITGKDTILEAIARAGGFTEAAVAASVVLIKGGFQHPEGRRLNLAYAVNAGDLSVNVVLQSEDIVYVPRKFIVHLSYTLSKILEPIAQGHYTVRMLHDW